MSVFYQELRKRKKQNLRFLERERERERENGLFEQSNSQRRLGTLDFRKEAKELIHGLKNANKAAEPWHF